MNARAGLLDLDNVLDNAEAYNLCQSDHIKVNRLVGLGFGRNQQCNKV
jgi:hypothetical protein